MNRTIITLLVSIVLIGCASKTIQVVDDDGNPVKGALVISEQFPFIMQSWKLGVYITDDKGEAVVVHNRGHIFKPGYFPVINASELNDGILWAPYSYFSKLTPVYPIKKGKKITISTTVYNTVNPVKKGVFIIPIDVCASKTVSYNVENSRLKVISGDTDIMLSQRFYYVGENDNKKVSEAESENNISFYCNEGSKLYKVGVSVSEKVWRVGVPDHKLTIFTAKVPSTETYLQPGIKCADSENVRMSTFGKYRDRQPDLYLSPDVKDKLSVIKGQVPCSNESTDKIFNYLEQFLKNS